MRLYGVKSKASQLQPLTSGTPFFEHCIALIAAANKIIHIQLYNLADDATGKLIFNALEAALARNVEVFLVVDAYASAGIAHVVPKHPKLHFRYFSPTLTAHGIQMGRRMHHKILVADYASAIIGGINIADKYHYNLNNEQPWLDFAVHITGDAAYQIGLICRQLWRKDFKKQVYVAKPKRINGTEAIPVVIARNDWFRRKIEISKNYKQAIRSARSEILIVNSYFLPGIGLRRLLRQAVKRGVKVKVVLAAHSDVYLVAMAMRYLYRFMLRNDITIYHWQPSVLHAKTMVVDGKLTTIGSYNLNALSDFGSLELNVFIQDIAFTTQFAKFQWELLSPHIKQLRIHQFLKKTSLFAMFWYWLSYQTIRIAFKVLFFFSPKQNVN